MEIKERFRFRVWNSKEMVYNGGLGYAEGNQLIEDKGCVIMQSTGLKDKNGKLIYEGDIVKIDGYGVTGVYEMKWCDVTAKFAVNIYEEDCFEHSQRVMEVIGNIYQNKELLEAQK